MSGNVLRSLSKCVYTNLAYEEYLLKNFSGKPSLFLWQNNPTVVIGRFQNPWLECDMMELRRNNVSLARRISGGGTVYHDLGNLNLSFFTNRKSYNRKTNLNLIKSAIEELTGYSGVHVNDRDDIILDDKWKISGSAARLLRNEALHHCTLLVNANIEVLNKVLKSKDPRIETAATRSLRVDVKCLSDIGIADPTDMDKVLVDLWADHYEIDGKEINFVDPSEIDFVQKRLSELQTWKWRYGNTPRFELKTDNFTFQINKGVIEVVRMDNGMELTSFENLKMDPASIASMNFDSSTEENAKLELLLAC